MATSPSESTSGVRGGRGLLRQEAWPYWVLALALGVGLVRFWGLGRFGLWFDEALTVTDGFGESQGILHNWGYRWIGITSDWWRQPYTEASLRWLPAVAGYLAIPLAYWTFLPLIGRGRAALLSLLMAGSFWQIYWSQNARSYTLTEAITLLGAGLFLRSYFARSGPGALVAMGILGISAKFHPHGSILAFSVAIAFFATALFSKQRDRHQNELVWVAGGGLILLVVLAPKLWAALQSFILSSETAGVFGGVASYYHLLRSGGFFLTPVVAVAALLGTLQILWTRDRPGLFAVVVVASMGGCLTVLSALGKVSAQYMFSLHPWILVLAVWPLNSLISMGKRGPVLALGWAGLLFLPGLSQVGLYQAVRHGDRPRWREAVSYVWQHRQEHDLILSMQAGLADLYLDPGFQDIRHPRLAGPADRLKAKNYKYAAREARPIWLVVRPAFLPLWEEEERRQFEAFLQGQCLLQERFEVSQEGRDLDLEVYYRPGR